MTTESQPATVKLAVESTTADAIQRAAYRLSRELSLELERDDQYWICRLHPAAGSVVDDAALHRFRTEVLDYTLRERIRAETEPVRNAVLALAFSRLDRVSDQEPHDG